MAKLVFGKSRLGEVSCQWIPPQYYEDPPSIKVTVETASLEVAVALYDFFPTWTIEADEARFRDKLGELYDKRSMKDPEEVEEERLMTDTHDLLDEMYSEEFERPEQSPQQDPPVFFQVFEAGQDFVSPMREAAELLGIIKPTVSPSEVDILLEIKTNLQILADPTVLAMDFLSSIQIPRKSLPTF